ncbi:hypothetical protein HK107_09990 [Parvularcula sp. ZS-1/3]|uniref:Alpha/beta hydrolase n=1 Tax=Parvularcula mediterranea TaxID=2732508 RepID=A0A7Y3RN25_9PROT|nr:hypothetical protein [Parvularcula mediterranea]NNU16650.1 hypothetical protein [Parvularcula mediterranea]
MDREAKDERPFRRHVFFVSGFDPRGPSPYYARFEKGVPLAAERHGMSLELSPRARVSNVVNRWTLSAERADGQTETTYDFLRWDDDIRRIWSGRKAPSLAAAAFFIVGDCWRRGFIQENFGIARALGLAVMLPPAALIVAALLSAVLGFGAWWLAGLLAGGLGEAAIIVQAAALAVVLGGLFVIWRWLDQSIGIWWLTRSFDFVRETAYGRFSRSEERSKAFVDQILAAVKADEADEIVLSCHSLGCLLLMRTVADALRADPAIGSEGPEVKVLFLGQSIAGYNAYDQDEGFKDDVRLVLSTDRLQVFDVTAGADPGTTCRMDMQTRLEPPQSPPRHIIERPAFHKSHTPERYKAIKADHQAYHFQYLEPTECGTEFDWFELLTRPRPIVTTRQEA